MRTSGDVPADLVKVKLHGMGIGEWQGECRARAAGRANGAEQVGRLVALIGRQPWAGAFSGPNPRASVLLADTGLILEPNFDTFGPGSSAQVRGERVGEVFLNMSITRSSC